MSQHLTLELSDEVYADLQQKANAVGLSVTEWIVTTLSTQNVQTNTAELADIPKEKESARQRFKQYAGAVDLGYATGVDNESIDADLAQAYAKKYEGQN